MRLHTPAFLGHLCACLILSLLWTCTESTPQGRPAVAAPDASLPALTALWQHRDRDGDTITDLDEGFLSQRDSDGDGVPDYLDPDSDGDTLPDRLEAGDSFRHTPPIDFDRDGVPDTLDLDSDDDTIADLYEGQDSDGDTVPDRHDPDSDGDGVLDRDEGGPGPAPRDANLDGIPDFRQWDADQDGIADWDERHRTFTDPTLPDSDGDGAWDIVERVAGTHPRDPDDFPDPEQGLFFVYHGANAVHPSSQTASFRTAVQTLDLYFLFDISHSMNQEFAAMRDPDSGIAQVISRLHCAEHPHGLSCHGHQDCPEAFVCGAKGRCIQDPEMQACIPDIWTGVGTFGNLDTFRNRLRLQSDPRQTAAAIPERGELARPEGRDGPLTGPWAEAPLQATTCVVDGDRCTNPARNCVEEGLGCPGFRPHAVRVLVQISDADNQCADPVDGATGTRGWRHFHRTHYGMGRCAEFTEASAGAALAAHDIKFIGLFGNADCDISDPDCDDFPEHLYNAWVELNAPERPRLRLHSPKTLMEAIGVAARSVDPHGAPFVYEALDRAVVEQTVVAVQEIIKKSPLRVQVAVDDVIGDDFDARQLVAYLRLDRSHPGCDHDAPGVDTTGDGRPDAYPALLPGAQACWEIAPQPGIDFGPHPELRTFALDLVAYGDASPLDRRRVTFIVPPTMPALPEADAYAEDTFWHAPQHPAYAFESRHGRKHGRERWWNPDGSLARLCLHRDGQPLWCQDLYAAAPQASGPITCPRGSTLRTRRDSTERLREATCHRPDGSRHGPYRAWHGNGQVQRDGAYQDDQAHGEWLWRDEGGSPFKRCHFVLGREEGCETVGFERFER